MTRPAKTARARTRIAGLRLCRQLRDETAATALEYVFTAVVLALAAIVAARVLTGVLIPYLHRIYVVVTLPVL